MAVLVSQKRALLAAAGRGTSAASGMAVDAVSPVHTPDGSATEGLAADSSQKVYSDEEPAYKDGDFDSTDSADSADSADSSTGQSDG